MDARTIRVPIFPLPGALLFPRAQLPLHIFEPRYRAMVRDALAGEEMIAMVQPRRGGEREELFDVGCLGIVAASEELADGGFNIMLRGVRRVRIAREVAADTPYRQVDADLSAFPDDDADPEPLPSVLRAGLERESRRYADVLGFAVDWDAVARLDDEALVNGIAQVAPFDPASKQALLEARGLSERTGLILQFMEFQRLSPGGADGPETMQ